MNRGTLQTAGDVLARLRALATKGPGNGVFVRSTCPDARSHDMTPDEGGRVFRCRNCGWWYRASPAEAEKEAGHA